MNCSRLSVPKKRHCYQDEADGILFKFYFDIYSRNGCSFLKVKKELILKLEDI